MNIWMRCATCIFGLLFVGAASAVSLSNDGSGQVLIYPYYTVNAGQHSTLTLSNTAGKAKAVKLVFRAGAAGNAAYVLNVYLGPHDTWTGTLFPWGSGTSAGPALLSNDSSCTVPDLHADDLPSVPDGRHYMRPNAGDQTSLPPGFPVDEGYVVAIEMGELGGASADALKYPYAPDQPPTPADCGKLVAAWQSGGYWRSKPATDVSAPTGGLSGTMTILQVEQGKVFRVDATALSGFRVAAMHTSPDTTTPDLGDAISDTQSGVASAHIPVGNKIIQSDYPADRAIDAVSAVLMAEQFNTHYDFRPSIGARTAFVISMPTKRFYVADMENIIPPFGRDEFQGTSPLGTLCPIADIRADDRNGSSGGMYPLGPKFYNNPEARLVPQPCYATSVLTLDPKLRPRSVLGSQLTSDKSLGDAGASWQAGPAYLLMNFYSPVCYKKGQIDCYPRPSEYTRAHINIMRPDLDGRQYFGLPAVGFAATGYINANGDGGSVLANYTFVSPYHRHRDCVQDDVVGACH